MLDLKGRANLTQRILTGRARLTLLLPRSPVTGDLPVGRYGTDAAPQGSATGLHAPPPPRGTERTRPITWAVERNSVHAASGSRYSR